MYQFIGSKREPKTPEQQQKKPMDLGLAGKNVLVVAASQGIGRKIALAFAGEGCRVSVIARQRARLAAVVAEMGGESRGHAFAAADLLPEGAAAATVKGLMERQGEFDVVVQNLGGTLQVRNVLAPPAEWARVWRYNVGAAIEINNLVLPGMVKRGWGRVVHISSTSAIDYRGSGPYAAAKTYLNAYINILGREMAGKGVVVSGVMPGAIIEDGNPWDHKSRDNPAMVADFLRHHQAIGRLGTTEELTPFILLLASDLATFATASVLPVHGGMM